MRRELSPHAEGDMMSVQRPYGQWDSPVEADSYTQTSVQLSQVRVDEADTYWV